MIVCKKCGASNGDWDTVCRSCSSALRAVNPFEGPNADPYSASQGAGQLPVGQAPAERNTTTPADVYHTAYGGDSSTFHEDSTISAGQWFMIVGMNIIPVVGNLVFIAIMVIFALGGTEKKTMVNFARAFFIFFAIMVVLGILNAAVFGTGDSSYSNELAAAIAGVR